MTPDLPVEPDKAIAVLAGLIGNRRDLLLVGSSLGGCYAAWLAGLHGLPAVLINPALEPCATLAPYLGTVRNLCTGEPFEWNRAYLEQLRTYQEAQPLPRDRLLVLLQAGDESIDYRVAAHRLAPSELVIEQGGSHAFERFPRHLDRIEAFHRRHLGPLRG